MLSCMDPEPHWVAWHEDYADPDSALSQRLATVVARLRVFSRPCRPGRSA